jgi:hypothetical protein
LEQTSRALTVEGFVARFKQRPSSGRRVRGLREHSQPLVRLKALPVVKRELNF